MLWTKLGKQAHSQEFKQQKQGHEGIKLKRSEKLKDLKDFYSESFKTPKKEMKEDIKKTLEMLQCLLGGRILKIALSPSHFLMQSLSKFQWWSS